MVTLDDFYLPNSQMIKEMVAAAVGERDKAIGDNIQLAHVGGIEWLVGLLKHPSSSIAQVMRDKTSIASQAELDFKNFVDPYAIANFPGWQVDNWMPAFDDCKKRVAM